MRLEPRLVALLTLTLASGLPRSTAAAPVGVAVAIDASPGSTRVVLTHDRSVIYTVDESSGKLKVVYADPIELRPAEGNLDDPILERYRLRDDRTLVLSTGKEYTRHETFELQNPFRLILDLKGRSSVDPRGDARGKEKKPPVPATILVVDPGHGGLEHGAEGPGGLMEKAVVLDIARELKRALERDHPSISVVLTRDEDRLVGLDERTAVANHNRADLFLSIHMNASPRHEASGAETYYLSTAATDDEARTLAALENRSSLARTPGGGEETGPLEWVLWDLAQAQYLAESAALAESVQRQLNLLTGTRDRGVRQAPFRVLMGATMPAILVEVGFLTNRDEAARLATPAYRGEIVKALSTAVREFLQNLDQLAAPAPAAPAPAPVAEGAGAP